MVFLSRVALHRPQRAYHDLSRSCCSVTVPKISPSGLRTSLEQHCVQVLCLDPCAIRDVSGCQWAQRLGDREVGKERLLARAALHWALGECLDVAPDVSGVDFNGLLLRMIAG